MVSSIIYGYRRTLNAARNPHGVVLLVIHSAVDLFVRSYIPLFHVLGFNPYTSLTALIYRYCE
ncbi:hypothetical protein BKA93DRAFT_931606 [Sparassis latifolia]